MFDDKWTLWKLLCGGVAGISERSCSSCGSTCVVRWHRDLFPTSMDVAVHTHRPRGAPTMSPFERLSVDACREPAVGCAADSRQLRTLGLIAPDTIEGSVRFAKDDDEPGLQAADLMAYEWRKRISDARHRPDKPVRKSYARIREARHEGALWRFGLEAPREGGAAG